MKRTLLLASPAIATAYALPKWPEQFVNTVPRVKDIQWGGCAWGTRTPLPNVECGFFEVPLDWAKPSPLEDKATLAVVRYRRLINGINHLGPLFYNPGGPGNSGVKAIMVQGEEIFDTTGMQYDIISWDPRGVGLSNPRVACFDNIGQEEDFWEDSVPRRGLEARGNLTQESDIQDFYAQADSVDSKLTQLAEKCGDLSDRLKLQHVGSVASVRDMLALSDALAGYGKKVNYWGVSYGTIIGSYLINMFHDRVGRVVLDGVVNPDDWSNQPPHLLWGRSIQSADDALRGFAVECAKAGPDLCAIAKPDSTESSILAWIAGLMERAYQHYNSPVPSNHLSSGAIRTEIFNYMGAPTRWKALAEYLQAVDQQLHDEIVTIPHEGEAGRPHTTTGRSRNRSAKDYGLQGITCSDAIDPSEYSTKDMFKEWVHVTQHVSQFFGPTWGDAGFYCHKWKYRSVERYTGPWNRTLSHPILVIGNEADPVTPFASAVFVAEQLGDHAVLLKQAYYGHTSSALPSNCTKTVIKNYFTTGELPKRGQICYPDTSVIFNPTSTRQTESVKGSSESSRVISINGSSPNSWCSTLRMVPILQRFSALMSLFQLWS